MKSQAWGKSPLRAFAASLALACGLLAGGSAHAGETAYTVRPTDLKSRYYSDAQTLRSLPTNTRVEILGRRGGWNHIKVEGKTGWVKMLSLRLGQVPQGRGDNGFSTLFNVAATGGTGSTSTTGVRGLSEEKLNNPHPNPQQLAKMHTLEVSKAQAERFAQAGHLKPEHMDYLPAPAK
jgi:Bacterial SH3 domain